MTLHKVYKSVPLGSICEIISGTTPSSAVPEYWNGEVKWITPAELSDDTFYVNDSVRKITSRAVKDCSLRPIPAGTVILSSRAPIGKVAIAATELYCNQGFKNLVCSEKIDNLYLYWFLKANTDHLNSLGSGATFKEISKKVIEKVEIPQPPIENQQTIATKLTKQLSAIDVLAKNTERQLQDAISLVARINKQTIIFNGKKQPLSKYCSEDKRIIQPEFEEAKTLKYLGMENIDKDTWEYIASTDILLSGNSTTYYFNENHVLYGKLRPYLKKVFLPKEAGRCSTELIPLLPADTMEREYLALLLTDDDLVSYIMSESTGARMPRSDMKKLLAYKVAVPDIDEQRARLKARNEQMKKCTELIIKLCKQQENITALRECVFKEAFGNEE